MIPETWSQLLSAGQHALELTTNLYIHIQPGPTTFPTLRLNIVLIPDTYLSWHESTTGAWLTMTRLVCFT